MTQPEVIAEHPYFGVVTVEKWRLVFHPPTGREDIEYVARFFRLPARESYELLAPRLDAFEAFCRRLDDNDRAMRDHFRSWPASAGEFEPVELAIDVDDHLTLERHDELRRQIPDWPIPIHGLQIRYRGFDDEAWGFTGLTWYPPGFLAYFDETTGAFVGLQDGVEQAMRNLPETITRSRWENAFYRHPYFGRRKLAEPFFLASISKLGTATFAGVKVLLELYMNRRTMADFEPEQLDGFVPLARRLEQLDAIARAKFPAKERTRWLADRFAEPNYSRLRGALDKIFPGATKADDVTPEAFAATLTPRRACFSLSLQDSGGAALTIDYHLLPQRLDNYLFAAKFAADGTLMEIVIES